MDVLEKLKSLNVLALIRYKWENDKLALVNMCAKPTLERLYWYQRSSVTDVLMSMTTIAALQCLLENQRQDTKCSPLAELPGFKSLAHFDSAHQCINTMLCTDAYSDRVAFQILKQEFTEETVTAIQDPANVDKLYKVQQQLDSLKEDTMAIVDKVIQRGGNLEDLERRSGALNEQSKHFYMGARKLNRCCIFM